MMNGYKLRDEVFKILSDTYARTQPVDWYSDANNSMCKDVTTAILAHVAWVRTRTTDAKTEYLTSTLFDEIRNIIWINFPGGTTAFGAAAKIAPLFNISVPDRKDY
jgi:hypothetical protein